MTAVATNKPTERLIPLNLLDPSPFNPRKTFEGLDELAASIKEHGQLQAIMVRPKTGGRFEIMGGERRSRAMKLLKATEIRAAVREATDAKARALQLVENLQRENIAPLEEARGFAELQDSDPKLWTPQAIAKAVSKTDRFVQQRLTIHRGLSDPLKKKFGAGEINVEVARTLATVPAPMQAEIANQGYRLQSADMVRERIFSLAVPTSVAIFPLDKYKGETIDNKGKAYFTDTAQFGKLQGEAARERMDKLKPDWPKMKLIDNSTLYDWAWADTGTRVAHDQARGKASSNVLAALESKQTAIAWFDRNGAYQQALGVVPATAIKEPRSGQFAGGGNSESADHRRARVACMDALHKGIGGDSMNALRLIVAGVLADRIRVGYDGAAMRKKGAALADPAAKKIAGMGYTDGRAIKAWEHVKKLPAPALLKLLAHFAGLTVTWQGSDKNPPAFTAAIAKAIGVKAPDFKAIAKAKTKAAADAKKAKAKAKPKAKKKAAPKAKKKAAAKK